MAITLLTGKNSFLIDQLLMQTIAKHEKEHGAQSVVQLSGHEADWAEITQSLTGVSLFESGERLVVLRHFSENKAIHESLAQWCQQHAESGDIWPALLLIDEAIDKRSNLYKVIKQTGEIEDVATPDEAALVRWIIKTVAAKGGSIDASTARYLIGRSSGSQQKLLNEVNTLTTYDPNVTKAHVDLLIPPSLNETIFQLLDYVSAGNQSAALDLYAKMRQHQTETHYIMTMISWQSSNMALVKAAGSLSDDQIAKQAKLSPYVIRKTRQLTSKLSVADLQQWLQVASEADIAIKTTAVDVDQVVKTLIAQLCAIVKN